MKRVALGVGLSAAAIALAVWFRSPLNRAPIPQRLASSAPAIAGSTPQDVLPAVVAAPASRELAADFPLAPKIEFTSGKLVWEERINSVLQSAELDERGKALQLLAMLPTLPEPALVTAAEEAVKRLPNSDYNTAALPVLANPQTHGLVAGVLFADLMERPEAITLPALLRLARTAGHAYAPFALDNLNLLLDADYGTDWQQWDAAIRRTVNPTVEQKR